MSDPIVIKGSHFFHSTNGVQFIVRGTTYQDNGKRSTESTDFIDPLADGPTCARDIPYLVGLGINTISLLAVDPTIDHSDCMAQLQQAGIYVITRLTGQPRNIDEDLVQKSTPWDSPLYSRFQKVIDEFQKYQNLLGFVVAADVEQSKLQVAAYPFVKAAVRDVKTYMKSKNYRSIPVGYFGTDFGTDALSEYLNCGPTQTSIDFFGTLRSSIWPMTPNLQVDWPMANSLIADYKNLSMPIVISEYRADDRIDVWPYNEVQALYATNFTQIFSGAIQYGYFHNYDVKGLVDVDGNNVTPRPNYGTLQGQLAAVKHNYAQIQSYTPTNVAPATCSDLSVRTSLNQAGPGPIVQIASTNLPPTPHFRLCDCMMQSLSCIAKYNLVDATNSTETTICQENDDWCTAVQANANIGTYGTYSVCNETQQQSWIFNEVYKAKGRSASTCNSLGGLTQTSLPFSSEPKDCKIYLRQAGTAGTGTITDVPALPPNPSDTDNVYIGLNTAAKVGIAVGIISVALMCFFIGFMFQSRLKKRKMFKSEDDEAPKEIELPATPPRTIAANTAVHELPEKGITASTETIVEVEDNSPVATELPAFDANYKDYGIYELPANENVSSVLDRLDRATEVRHSIVELPGNTGWSSARQTQIQPESSKPSVGTDSSGRDNNEASRESPRHDIQIFTEVDLVSAIDYTNLFRDYGDEPVSAIEGTMDIREDEEPPSAIEEENTGKIDPQNFEAMRKKIEEVTAMAQKTRDTEEEVEHDQIENDNADEGEDERRHEDKDEQVNDH